MSITDAERQLIDWQYEKSGSFYHHLMWAIAKSDHWNRAKIAQGFPELVEAMDRYQGEPGYWDDVLKRASKREKPVLSISFGYNPQYKSWPRYEAIGSALNELENELLFEGEHLRRAGLNLWKIVLNADNGAESARDGIETFFRTRDLNVQVEVDE